MACVRLRRLQSQCVLYLALISLLSSPEALAASTGFPTSLPGCQDKCGNITIPYPFGTSPGCYRDGFNVTCNTSFTPPKAFLGGPTSNIELLNISLTSGEARVYKHVGYRCYDNLNKIGASQDIASMNLAGPIYLFSNRRNKFTVIGCDTLIYILGQGGASNYRSGCASYCEDQNSTTGDGSCNGLGCCQTSIPAGLNYYQLYWGYENNSKWDFNPCNYAVLVEENWYQFNVTDLNGTNFYDRTDKGRVPIVLDWAIRDNGTSCQLDGKEKSSNQTNLACISENSICQNTTNGKGYLCNCSPGYEGNPYRQGKEGCIDIDECTLPNLYPCNGTCINKEGSYECPCKRGKKGNGTAGTCTDSFPYPARVSTISILGVVVFLGTCFLVAEYQQHKRHAKEKEAYQRYYQMMHDKLRVFTRKQIDSAIQSATNNFGETHVLGSGGQGKVYKGLLENNQFVAIKKAKEVEEKRRGEFVNEILLLSQINHRNIVRLLGCCLEVKIPMLVYEFVPNGSLFDLLHGKSKITPISLHKRLKVALESAEALDYLHSSASQTILHGDVKSANILLDNDYHAKVSDFGASNLVPIDGTQIDKVAQGTPGYIDPEYMATAILTRKSDVYSFGVVLLELITRKYAIFSNNSSEKKALAACFVSNANKNKLHNLLDKDIVSTDKKVIDILQEVSDLAVWCLSVQGEDRPTMRQVVEKLQGAVRLHSSLMGPPAVHEETERLLSESTFYPTSDTSAFSNTTGYSSVLEIETRLPR